MPTFGEIVTAILTLLGGGLFGAMIAVMRLRAQNSVDNAQANKADAEAGKTLGEAWATLYSNLERRVNDLEKKIEERDDMIDDLTAWAEKLVSQLKEAKIEPVPFVRRRGRE